MKKRVTVVVTAEALSLGTC